MTFLKSTLLLLTLLVIVRVNSQTTSLGDVQVNPSISIKSLQIETNFKFSVDITLQSPKISIGLSRGNAAFKDIVQSNSASEVVIGNFEGVSNGNKIGIFSFLTIFFTILSLGLIGQSRRSTFLIVGVVGVSLIASVYALQLDSLTVEANIVIPLGFKFDSISIQSVKGSLDLTGLQATNINIDSCSGYDTFPIILNSFIGKNINICSRSNVQVNDLQVSTPTNINLQSDGNVTLGFLIRYLGNVDLESVVGTTPTIIGNCSVTTSTVGNNTVTKGNCNGDTSGTNSLRVVGNSNVTFVANSQSVQGSCSTSPTWRDPDPSSAGPPSPSIPSQLPILRLPYPSTTSQWGLFANYNITANLVTTPAGNVSGGVPVGGSLSVTFGGPNLFWLISRSIQTFLRASQTYTFDFSMLLGQPQLANQIFNGAELCIIQGLSLNYNIDGWIPDDPVNFTSSYTCFKYSGSFSSNTAWMNKSVSFSVPTDITNAQMALRFNYTYNWNPRTAQTFYFDAITHVIPARPVVQPTLLTKDSELVVIPKQPTTFTAQDRSTCPHKQSGLLHWHDPATWGGVMPSPSSLISIPNNTKVLISSCSLQPNVVYQKIYVPPSSELIFSDANITMNIQDMYVEGKLWIGSTSCRMNGRIELVFFGAFTTSDTINQYMGSKGIASSKGGWISIQGKQYTATWTRLAATAYPYDQIIYLQDTVNWEVGQQVILTTSRYQDEYYKENEVATIIAVSGSGRIIQLAQPLSYYHYAGTEYQIEVGLLSRRIRMRGDPSSSNPANFGGHVMAMGNAQFAGIELVKMGQRNMRARYPLHFHLAGVVNNSYVTDCSVRDTFYRCVTIHGTHNLTVQQNVAYNATGHCYYIEDGVEENSTLAYNLAAVVSSIGVPAAGAAQTGQWFYENDQLRQPADAAAAGFYITNAYNRFIGNAASGGWSGYSFPNLNNSIGMFKDVVFNPSTRPNLQFEGNTAHSSGYFFVSGSCIYCGGWLGYNSTTGLLKYLSGRMDRTTTDLAGNDAWMRYNNTKTFLCSDGVAHWGQRLEVVNYESHDNHRSGTLFGASWLNNAIVNGASGNPARSIYVNKQGFQFYDTWTRTVVSNVQFRNFIADPTNPVNPEDDNRVLVSMTHSDVFKPQGISAMINITFSNVARRQQLGHYIVETGSSRYFNFVDWDGSFAGRSGPAIIGSHLNWWNFDNTCAYEPLWSVWICNRSAGREVGNLDWIIPGLIDYNTYPATSIVGNSTLFGPGITGRRSSFITQNYGITGVTGAGWYLYLNQGSPTYFELHTRLVPYGTYIVAAVRYPTGTTFTVDQWYEWRNPQASPPLAAATSFANMMAGSGNLYFFDNQHLYIKLVNPLLTNAPIEKFTRANASIYAIFTGFKYRVQATCNGCNFKLSDVLPTQWS